MNVWEISWDSPLKTLKSKIQDQTIDSCKTNALLL